MVVKKKELIAASLVVLIGVAGYLNWSYQDTISVRDGESYIETGKKLGEAQYVSSIEEIEEETGENKKENAADENTAAEETATTEETAATEENIQNADETEKADEQAEDNQAEPTVETASDNGSYFDQARMDKETSRSKSLEILNQTAANESFDEEIRKKAGDKIIAEADNVEKESAIESLAQSKGYSEICVYIDDSVVNVTVRKDGFSDQDVTVLCELVTSQTEFAAKDIKIIEVK